MPSSGAYRTDPPGVLAAPRCCCKACSILLGRASAPWESRCSHHAQLPPPATALAPLLPLRYARRPMSEPENIPPSSPPAEGRASALRPLLGLLVVPLLV